MAGTLTISTLSDGTNSTSATNCVRGSATAWANFVGSSGSVRSSYNVSSITRNGTGDYTVNFTTAFSNVNYVPQLTGMRDSDNNGSLNTTVRGNPTYTGSFTTTTLRVLAENDSGTRVDPTYYGVTVFS